MTFVAPRRTRARYLALVRLAEGETSGRELREHLARAAAEKSPAAFYAFMASLEDAGYVEHFDKNITISGQLVKPRWFRITDKGRKFAEIES